MPATLSPMKLLDDMYNKASSERDKGERFERFVQSFLQTDPTWAQQFSHVWMWNDWPDRPGPDNGVDLVAERRDGGLTAVQCKFYDPTHYVSKADIDSFLAESGRYGFTERLIVSTTTKWGPNAEATIRDQAVPVRRLGLEDFEQSRIDWGFFDPETPTALSLEGTADLRPYQRTAIEAVTDGFMTSDRGRLIMACGTGKTFTSLRLAEEQVGEAGSVLFLVPSIALLSQAMREWSNQTVHEDMRAIAVCSDAKVSKGRRKNEDTQDVSTVDLAQPATTDPGTLAQRMKVARAEGTGGLRVVFATYQSIDVVARAQEIAGLEPFDLIICDEAHRTTGVTIAGQDESAFVKVHDEGYIRGTKRLYMTATPRIYDDASKAKAGRAQAVLASMDDEDTFGPELYRLGFGEAVSLGMLTDYKVLILTVNEGAVSESMQEAFAQDGELTLDDATRLIGCWNGLAKRGDVEHDFGLDTRPMRRAVAFTRSIKDSKKVRDQFTEVVGAYSQAHDGVPAEDLLKVEVEHVDGSMNALERNGHLDWLREDTEPNTCRVLSNARCLSEGVDVPSLDAVMFLNPRKSVVDVVQSVGRVMRLAQGKKYGYIILPVVVPTGQSPEKALDDNKNFQVVWEVLQALRAHDERFDAMVNKLELNKKRDDKVNVIGVGFGGADGEGGEGSDGSSDGSAADAQGALELKLSQMDGLRDAIYAKMVKKVGTRRYWEQWAKDVADIAQAHIARITRLVDDPATDASHQFDVFLDALRRNLNDSITRDGAIEMLAQHMITKPVFDALFADYEFTAHNPVSQVMETMVQALVAVNVDAESQSLEGFYASVRERAAGIDNAEGKQKIITELYENFFKKAFAKTSKAMGVVYTPVEIVDFIIRSVNDVLRQEFGRTLSDEGVHVLDPFTGTGTFIVRLLQSGLIRPDDIARKYASELHANEILLLAYYIAAINIETTFHDLMAQQAERVDAADVTEVDRAYEPFDGIVLTDTFQLTEDGDLQDPEVFPVNNARAEEQKKLDIRVIVGNPPYSVGQTSENDDNQNVSYPTLDARIRETFAESSTGDLKKHLYDSYMRAIRWASDRIGSEGVVGFVTNGGWIEGNTAAGVRKTLANEFSSIYVFNLRGNQRTAGEQSRKEGGKVFGSGSRNTVAIFLLVKTAGHQGTAKIYYRDVGDYLTARQKLDTVASSTLKSVPWQEVVPNQHGDWMNQRDEQYLTYPSLFAKKSDRQLSVFGEHGAGLVSNRDAWAYSFGCSDLDSNANRFVQNFNEEAERLQQAACSDPRPSDEVLRRMMTDDPRRIKWTSSLRSRALAGTVMSLTGSARRVAQYRPFEACWVDMSDGLINRPVGGQRFFPALACGNFGIHITGVSSHHEFSALATRNVPDMHLLDTGQFFPRYRWEPSGGVNREHADDAAEPTLDLSFTPASTSSEAEVVQDGYRRVDNVTDEFHTLIKQRYGDDVTKDNVFYFIYGLLQSPDYRRQYAGELKQMLPRVPDVPAGTFHALTDAGRELFHLHADYEDVEPYPLEVVGGEQPPMGGEEDYYRVKKMRFPAGKHAADRPDSIIVNDNITVTGIPEKAYSYQLGSRSAIEWIMRQYQVTTDKASGIVNDPNQWGIEHGNPRYILDLLQKVVAISVKTMLTLSQLPRF